MRCDMASGFLATGRMIGSRLPLVSQCSWRAQRIHTHTHNNATTLAIILLSLLTILSQLVFNSQSCSITTCHFYIFYSIHCSNIEKKIDRERAALQSIPKILYSRQLWWMEQVLPLPYLLFFSGFYSNSLPIHCKISIVKKTIKNK